MSEKKNREGIKIKEYLFPGITILPDLFRRNPYKHRFIICFIEFDNSILSINLAVSKACFNYTRVNHLFLTCDEFNLNISTLDKAGYFQGFHWSLLLNGTLLPYYIPNGIEP
jgi:hypothetical protein